MARTSNIAANRDPRLLLPTRAVGGLFGALIVLLLAVGVVAILQLRSTSEQLEEVMTRRAESVIQVERLSTASERMGRSGRTYLLTGDPRFLEELDSARAAFDRARLQIRQLDPTGLPLLDLINAIEREHEQAVDQAISLRQRGNGPMANAVHMLEAEVQPIRDRLDLAVEALREHERQVLERARLDAAERAEKARQLVTALFVATALIAAGLGLLLSRTLARLGRHRGELAELLSRLENANRDLDAFAGRVAHDMRNVLAPLPLVAARLKNAGGRPEVIATSAERVERVGTRATTLIEALLAFSRAGRAPEPSARASVRSAVAGAMEGLAPLQALVGAEVSFELEDLHVACSPGLFETVVANLVGNALKFLEGSPTRKVRITARQAGPLAELSVEDTGPGIPTEVQELIFNPFYRAPGAKAPGTGIGLATVQRILAAHGGQITVRSRPGGGSTFTARMPLRDGEAVAPGPRPEVPLVH